MKLIAMSLVLAIGANLYSNAEAAGTSLCYNCFAVGGCEDPPIIQCPKSDEKFSCVTVKIPALGSSQIVQGCTLPESAGIKKLCDDIQSLENGSCEFCYNDLCNSI